MIACEYECDFALSEKSRAALKIRYLQARGTVCFKGQEMCRLVEWFQSDLVLEVVEGIAVSHGSCNGAVVDDVWIG